MKMKIPFRICGLLIVMFANWFFLGLPISIIFCKILGYEFPFPMSGHGVVAAEFVLYKKMISVAFAIIFPIEIILFYKLCLKESFPIHKYLLITTMIAQLFSGFITSVYPQFSSLSLLGYGIQKTEYSQGFSYTNFAKVKHGMTRNEVKNLIGSGFEYEYAEAEHDKSKFWRYSKPFGTCECYWMIIIGFNSEDLVEEIVFNYWLD